MRRTKVAGFQIDEQLDDEQTIAELTLKLATPMIGGGAEAGKVDEHWPIRASEIRGHLRFWWRALWGCTMEPKQMAEAEAELFGSTATAGRISIDVTPRSVGSVMEISKTAGIPQYVRGVLTQGGEPIQCLEACTFDLEVGYSSGSIPKGLKDVLAAWVAYGGLGARVRRGAGCLEVVDRNGQTIPEWPRRRFSATEANEVESILSDPLVPSLRGSILAHGPACGSSQEAYFKAINAYQCLRKGLSPADAIWYMERAAPGEAVRLPHAGEESHSRWPERASALAAQGHGGGAVTAPRANLGLPVQFRFRGGDYPRPADTEIELQGSKRFASPLVVKACRIGGGWYPIWLLLNAPGVDTSVVRMGGRAASPRFDALPGDLLPAVAKEARITVPQQLRTLVRGYARRLNWKEVAL